MRPIIIIVLKPNNTSKTWAIESMILSPPKQSQVYLYMLILFLVMVTVQFFLNCSFSVSSLSAVNYLFLKISTSTCTFSASISLDESIALFIAQLQSNKALSNLLILEVNNSVSQRILNCRYLCLISCNSFKEVA